jgi:cephalosporin hydroxylase
MMTLPPEKFHMIQRSSEFEQLLDIFIKRKPKNILELGVGHGGTLWEWNNNASNAVICAVSLFTNGGVPDILPDIAKWNRLMRNRIIPIDGRTDDPRCIELARAGGPYDWLHIDADHSYAAAKFDYETYGAMVQPGGVIVFHDIGCYPDEKNPWIQVRLLWDEIKATGAKTVEFIEDPNDPTHCFGIGVLFK